MLLSSLLALVLPVVVAACTGGGDDDVAEGETTTTTVLRSTAEVAPLDVGQCGDVPEFRVGGVLDPARLEDLPCEQPHDVEVGAVFDHPSALGVDFPGAESVDDYAFDECVRRFEEYVGVPYETSMLDFVVVAPGEDGWEDGDRRIACVLYHVDFAPLTGSVRGTAT